MQNPDDFLRASVNYLEILRELDEGVTITDADGHLMFMNHTHARIDGVDPSTVIGKTPSEIWDVTEETSLILRCLQRGRPFVNQYLAYRTRTGRIANTINSVFPLLSAGKLVGSISFVRAYNLMEETITSICSMVEHAEVSTKQNGTRFTFPDIVGTSLEFLDCLKTAKMAALTPSQVMIHGATGAGKELFAQSMHNYGPRKEKTYVGINCAAIPENLLEGLLFGTTKGAFTGASDKPGLFEKANHGTLFLDEINSMPLGLQAKLLRAIQERRIRRVGSLEERPFDVKLLSSLNEDPHIAIENQRLRLDLFYRLGVVMLYVPSLKERLGDIPVLTRHFIDKYNQVFGRHIQGISADVEELFHAYPWPGNVRELEHAIEGAMNLVGEGSVLKLSHLPRYLVRSGRASVEPPQERPGAGVPAPRAPEDPGSAAPEAPLPPTPAGASLLKTQAEAEQRSLAAALAEAGGNLTRAARSLGVSRQRLAYRMAKHGLDRKDFQGKGPGSVQR